MIIKNIICEMHRVKLTEYLQNNDRNGCYTDENCEIEGVPKMTSEDIIIYYFFVNNEDEYLKICDNACELDYEQAISYSKEKGFYNPTLNKLLNLLGGLTNVCYKL